MSSTEQVTLETIEKMKQPKTTQHKRKISKSITNLFLFTTRLIASLEYGEKTIFFLSFI